MAAAERKYLEADVETASPLRLVLMVYDIAVSSLARAKALDPEKERVDFIDAVSKGQEAILTLLEGLDASKSPELAAELSRLYGYLYRRLSNALVDGDLSAIEEAVTRLSELRSAWQELLEKGLGEESRPDSPADEGRIVSITG